MGVPKARGPFLGSVGSTLTWGSVKGVWKLRLPGVPERRVQGLGLRVLESNDAYYKELYPDYSRDLSSDCRGLGFRV